jgi:hypothetical protein
MMRLVDAFKVFPMFREMFFFGSVVADQISYKLLLPKTTFT